jgi:energy-coupling factor transporter ATP-binding protein EcfA2
MWPDNETNVDLLGFDYIVDSLEIILTQPRLLPLTVGVLGDWGSGKSSLLQMVAARLEPTNQFVIVNFSPWRYEAYEDVKSALMEAVLAGVGKQVPPDGDSQSWLQGLWDRLGRMRRASAAMARVVVPAGTAFVAAHEGLPPELAAATGQAVVAGAEAFAGGAPAEADVAKPSVVYESVADFRAEFEHLVESLTGIKAVVVLIDDLDRCLDDTVIEVFEAIRLFLQVSCTAFVIAANREIVQAAIERRYPATHDGGSAVGKDYLEKILQVEVAVPPLSEPEAETYLNLLFAELRLGEEQMTQIRAEATRRRSQGQFAVAMNYGIANGVLGSVEPVLEADFAIANRVAPILSRGLRGNPRQLKRFLNTLLLRLQTANRRSVELDPGILAKLMVLEQLDARSFRQLFLWQLQQDGAPAELSIAEAEAAGGNSQFDTSEEFKTWMASATVPKWLALEPRLAGVPLGEYFFFSRDRLSAASPAVRLSANQQALLSKLQLDVRAQRRGAVDDAARLPVEEFTPLYEALLERAARNPGSLAVTSAIELAEKQPASWPALAAMLKNLPPGNVPSALPLRVASVGAGRPEVTEVLDQWGRSRNAALVKAVAEAKKALN